MKHILVSLAVVACGALLADAAVRTAEYVRTQRVISERKRRYAERRARLQPHWL